MSEYFQRLMEQSGLGIQSNPATPAFSPAAAAPPALAGRPDGGGLVEIHDERMLGPESAPAPVARSGESTETIALTAAQPAEPDGFRSAAAHTPAASATDATEASPSPAAAAKISRLATQPVAASERSATPPSPTPSGAADVLVVAENIAVGPSASAPATDAPASPPVSTPSADALPPVDTAPAQPAPPQRPPEQPATAVLQAVMRWIAAGPSADRAVGLLPQPAPTSTASPGEATRATAGLPHLADPATTTAAPALSPAAAAHAESRKEEIVPSRVIEIGTMASAQPLRAVARQQPAESPAARPPRTVPETASRPARPEPPPVHVSIGAIEVRVEAPPVTAPKPARVVRAPEPARPAAPAARPSTFSRLRRHYIIPH